MSMIKSLGPPFLLPDSSFYIVFLIIIRYFRIESPYSYPGSFLIANSQEKRKVFLFHVIFEQH